MTEPSAAADSVSTGHSVTVVIPTRNAAEVLEGCLASVSWADEIIVVDMHSTDRTGELCARYPRCRVVLRDDYIFGNVNHGIDLASSAWILRLDSDERITPELRDEIQAFVRRPPVGVTGLACWERNFILGRELTNGFGRRHHRKLLFRRGTARYAVKSEHEDLTSEGSWSESRHGYIHLNYRSVRQYLEKTNYYTDKDVERTEMPAVAPTVWSGIRETARAFYLYFLRWRGYRDGWIGFLDAAMKSFYQLVLWAKLRERFEAEARGSNPDSAPSGME